MQPARGGVAGVKPVWLIIEIVLVVDLLLWLFSIVPYSAKAGPFNWLTPWTSWIAAVLLAVLVLR